MSHYCSVCGRKLTKTVGPIGPKCLEKINPRNKRSYITKAQRIQAAQQYDMFEKKEGED